MSSGKTHAIIGAGVSIIGTSAYMYTTQGAVDYSVITPVLVGSVFGSLVVDIDTKKSKASQAFAKVITSLVWVYLIGTLSVKYIPSLSETLKVNSQLLETSGNILSSSSAFILQKALSLTTNNLGVFLMCVLITLGKLSPHRQFTHKWFGTLLFLSVGFLMFSYDSYIGFFIGYVMHLVADSRTPAGLDFLDFKLPMQNRKGKFNPVF